MPSLIFVHGACVRDAPWWWSRMTEPLAGHGLASVAVALPSCGEAGDALGDLYADVEATRKAIAEAEAPVALCGHSYGGMVTEGRRRPAGLAAALRDLDDAQRWAVPRRDRRLGADAVDGSG